MLEEIKEYIKVNWDNENASIQGIILRGKGHLNGLTGTEINFDMDEGLGKSLLFDYCRYSYNNALEYFEDNFSKEILRLQLQEAIKERGKNEG